MNKLRYVVWIWGNEHFFPSQIERDLGLIFHDKQDPGDIESVGRNRGKTCLKGFAEIEAPTVFEDKENELGDRNWILNFFKKNSNFLYSKGVEKMNLRIYYEYDSQCNFDFGIEMLSILVKNKITLSVTAEFNGNDSSL
jgi:hypothetical protein